MERGEGEQLCRNGFVVNYVCSTKNRQETYTEVTRAKETHSYLLSLSQIVVNCVRVCSATSATYPLHSPPTLPPLSLCLHRHHHHHHRHPSLKDHRHPPATMNRALIRYFLLLGRRSNYLPICLF